MSEIIGVIGAGTMGNGIAQTAASKGFDVVICDVQQDFVDRGIENIGKSLDRFIKKETLTEEGKSEILGRIKSTTNLEDLKDCSLIVEAATENFEIKKQIFQKLDEITSENTIFLPTLRRFPLQKSRELRNVRTKSSGCISLIRFR